MAWNFKLFTSWSVETLQENIIIPFSSWGSKGGADETVKKQITGRHQSK